MAYFNLPFGVRVANNEPIDGDRYLAANTSARNALITGSTVRAYNGLQVYQQDVKKLYILNDIATSGWTEVGSTVSAGGLHTNIQFNSGGTLSGDTTFVYDPVNKYTGILNSSPSNTLHVGYYQTNHTIQQSARTYLEGENIYNGSQYYGTYGMLEFGANSNFSSNSRRFLLTNAYLGYNFAIIKSVDAITSPKIGLNGSISSGDLVFYIDYLGNATFNGNLSGSTIYENGVSLVSKYAQIIHTHTTDNITNLSTYTGLTFYWTSGTTSSYISIEASTRTSVDASLSTAISTASSNISTEFSTRPGVDTSLSTAISKASSSISSEFSTRPGVDTSLSTAISTASSNISTEFSTRPGVDASLSTAISTASSNISTEFSTRPGVDTSLSTAISTGNSIRLAIDTSLSTAVSTASSNISTEFSTRPGVDASLSTAISTTNSTRLGVDTSLSTAVSTASSNISTEFSTRPGVDASLSTAISTASSNISTEFSTRPGVDASLSTALSTASSNISTEFSTRPGVDTSLSTAISRASSSVSSEFSTRPGVDASLSTAISTTDSVRLGVDTSLSTAVSTASSNISTEFSTRPGVDASLSTAISSANSIRLGVDTSLSTAVSTASGNISTEFSTRPGVDASLSTAIGTRLPLAGGTLTGGLTGTTIYTSSDLRVNGNLYVNSMVDDSSVAYMLYYDLTTGKISRGTKTSGTVTSITVGDGLSASPSSPITTSGTISMGTPTTLTPSTTNSVSSGTHSHKIDLFLATTGGTMTGQLNSSSSVLLQYTSASGGWSTNSLIIDNLSTGEAAIGFKNSLSSSYWINGINNSLTDIEWYRGTTMDEANMRMKLGTTGLLTVYGSITTQHNNSALNTFNGTVFNAYSYTNSSVAFGVGGELYLSGITNTTASNFLYYDSGTRKVSYATTGGLFLPTAGGSMTGTIRLTSNSTIISRGASTYSHVSHLGDYRNSTTVTGAIVFTAPTNLNDVMHQIHIKGFLYNPTKVIDTTVNFTIDSSGKLDTSYNFIIHRGTEKPQVRVAKNTVAGTTCIVLGETGVTSWSYPHIVISRALFSKGASVDTYSSTWSAFLATISGDFTNYSLSGLTSPVNTALTTDLIAYLPLAGGTLTGGLTGTTIYAPQPHNFVHSTNEITLLNGYGGGNIWINYRGTSSRLRYIMGSGLATSTYGNMVVNMMEIADKLYVSGLTAGTTSNYVYYDSSSRELKWGASTLSGITDSSYTVYGYEAGAGGISGSQSVVIGSSSGPSSTGSYNTFVGYMTGNLNTTSGFNTFLGTRAGEQSTGGSNTFLGYYAGRLNTSGTHSVFIGLGAGYNENISDTFIVDSYTQTPSSTYSLLYGKFSNGSPSSQWLRVNGGLQVLGGLTVTGITSSTSSNIIYYNSTSKELTWGSASSAVSPAGSNTQVQYNNSGSFGASSNFTFDGTNITVNGNITGLYIKITGTTQSTWVGSNGASENPSSPRYNVGVGYLAGVSITTGTENTVIGYGAGNVLGTNSRNTFIGRSSGVANSSGGQNVFVGMGTGNVNNGSGSVFIGYYAGSRETGSNKLFIDNQDRTTEANSRNMSLVYGEFSSSLSTQLLKINGKFYVSGLTNNTGTTIVYYDTTTKELTYGAASATTETMMSNDGSYGAGSTYYMDVSQSKRRKVIVTSNVTIDIINLPSSYSTTTLIDIINSSGGATITWYGSGSALSTSAWVDASPITTITAGYTYSVSITTNGTTPADMLLNWVKKG